MTYVPESLRTVGRAGYMYWPTPSSGIPGSRGEKRAQLGVQAVARADLDLAVAHARVEAVQRAHRRAAGDLALEVVDAAVARADEALGGFDVAHRAAEVHAARRDRDVVVVLVLDLGIELVVVLAHVDGRTCRPRRCRARSSACAGCTCRRGSRRSGRRSPSAPRCFSNTGPKAMPSAGSVNAAVATAPAPWVVIVMNRRRVTVSPSNEPGIFASAVVFGFFLRSSGTGRGIYRSPALDGPVLRAAVASGLLASGPRRLAQGVRRARIGAACALLRGLRRDDCGPCAIAATPASQAASASCSSPDACACAPSEMTSASSAIAVMSPISASRARPSAYMRSPASRRRSSSSMCSARACA